MQNAACRMQRGSIRRLLVAVITPLSAAVCILQAGFLFFPPLAQSQELMRCTDVMPLRPSATWTYQGTVLWSGAGASTSDSTAVGWTMTVERVRDLPAGRLALVRGLVTQLAWYEPGRPPRLALLICSGSRLYALEVESDSIALDAFEHWNDRTLSRSEVWLELPLRDGARFGQDPPRSDPMYGWLVERLDSAKALPPGCRSGSGPRFAIAYRTLPDHRVIEWQPGLGITAFTYGHHGTPAGAEVVLASCRQTNP
jgi:hypothetical protein